MRVLSCLALLALAIPALAVPMEFTHQGRLFDGVGAPIDGANDVTFAIYDAPSSGTALWTETASLDFEDGYYRHVLGSTTALDGDIFDGDTLYLGMTVGTGAELPQRLPIVSVPYAVRAGIASDLQSGIVIDASEIRIDGSTVIDSSGQIDAGALDASSDTLAELGCGTGQITAFDGTDWQCADASGHEHEAADLTSGVLSVSRIPIGTGASEVAAGDHGHTAIDVGALPAGTTAADIGALPAGTTAADIGALPAGTTAADIGALPAGTTAADIGALPAGTTAADIGALPAGTTAADIGALPAGTTAADIGALPAGTTAADIGALPAGAPSSPVIGDNTATCDSSTEGSVRWNGTSLQFCDGSDWRNIRLAGTMDGSDSGSAGTSCKQILTDFPGLPSSSYWIDPEQDGSAMQLWCDMTTDGGGWTRVQLAIAGDTGTMTCDNAAPNWTTTLDLTTSWPNGGEVMSKVYHSGAGAESAAPATVVKFQPGPYNSIYNMFDFQNRGENWQYSNSGVFSLQNLAGTAQGNNIWWNYSGNGSKAEFCIGSQHQYCFYSGHSTTCPTIYVSGAWRSSGFAGEIYVREP